MSGFIYTSVGMVLGYFFAKKGCRWFLNGGANKKPLTSNHGIEIPKFIGKKSLAIDFSNLFHFHAPISSSSSSSSSSLTSHPPKPNSKVVIPVATLKSNLASKISICYTDETNSDTKIKSNQKLVVLPFSEDESSILPPFSSYPTRFKELFLCFDDEESGKHFEHKIDTQNLPLGIGWWNSEVDKLISKIT